MEIAHEGFVAKTNVIFLCYDCCVFNGYGLLLVASSCFDIAFTLQPYIHPPLCFIGT